MDLAAVFKQYKMIYYMEKQEILAYALNPNSELSSSELVDYSLINSYLLKKIDILIPMHVCNEVTSLLIFKLENLKSLSGFLFKIDMPSFMKILKDIVNLIVYMYTLNDNFSSFDANFCFYNDLILDELHLKTVHIRKYIYKSL